jgi:general secretion pathway protein M
MALAVFEKWGLNPREQRLATIAVFALGVLMLLAVPVGLSMLVSSRRAENEELREALSAVNGARGKIQERKAKRDQIASRYGERAPALAGFLEQHASRNGLQVTDSVDRPDVPHGKRYVERHTLIHLKKAGMLSIAKFLEGIEKSGLPVSVSRLNIRKRSGEPDSYDVEVGVSAFDRSDTPPAKPKPKEEPQDKDEESP